MKLVRAYFRELGQALIAGWDRFWFTPSDPATLGLIRLLGGAMLFYTHLVWSLELEAFFGPKGWVDPAAFAEQAEELRYAWSYFYWIQSPTVLWTVHVVALVVFALLTLGLFTRVVSILAFLITVSYTNRAWFALFGLDDINAMLAMYLMIGPSGEAFSLDRWLARRQGRAGETRTSVTANIAIRLMQVHMCVIYLFSALGKMMGESWWDGTAIWGAIGNLEYQSIDMTWLAHWPLWGAVMTHTTVAWELSYPVLVWPRLTRPLVLAMAVPLHLGIALFLGMMTFGLVMLIANLAFVSPWVVRAMLDRSASGEPLQADRAGEGKGAIARAGGHSAAHVSTRGDRTKTAR